MVEKAMPPAGATRLGRRRLMGPESRRAVVLEAAIAVFAEDGLHGASMERIAARAGVAKASCYEAFPSKEAMFSAAVSEVDAQLNGALEATARDAALRDQPARMRARFAATFDFARARPASFRLFTLSLFNRTTDIDRVYEGVRQAALDRLALDVPLCAVASDPELDPERVADLLTEFTTAGLAAMSMQTLEAITQPERDLDR